MASKSADPDPAAAVAPNAPPAPVEEPSPTAGPGQVVVTSPTGLKSVVEEHAVESLKSQGYKVG